MAEANQQQPEEDVTLPRAALNKMIKELLPNVRVANDARELILNCCTEFIHLISSEANDVCLKRDKKTISPEHILAALDSLGFGAYLEDCRGVLEECKTVAAKKRRQSNRLENLGIPEEELLRQQMELFAKAREEQAAIEQQEWVQLQAAQAAQGQTVQQQQQQPGGQQVSIATAAVAPQQAQVPPEGPS
ncbi:protein Dr1-like [Amphiura filiformis]|uniref:protein Dr1-like n=1 Tax=Amphiura filiformis TaxID=82378 RepID=UPI003B22696F